MDYPKCRRGHNTTGSGQARTSSRSKILHVAHRQEERRAGVIGRIDEWARAAPSVPKPGSSLRCLVVFINRLYTFEIKRARAEEIKDEG